MRVSVHTIVTLADIFVVPRQIGFTTPPANPALPAKKSANIPSRYRAPTVQNTLGNGSKRVYLDLQAKYPNAAYPPRPVPGSVADMDVIMDHCDFTTGKVYDMYILPFFVC